MNGRPLKKREGTRREAYLAEELEYMRPLPSVPYEPAVWTPELRVGQDCLVSDGKNKITALDGYTLHELASAIYVDAPDENSSKRRQHIHIKYDGIGFIPLDELIKKETA